MYILENIEREGLHSNMVRFIIEANGGKIMKTIEFTFQYG